MSLRGTRPASRSPSGMHFGPAYTTRNETRNPTALQPRRIIGVFCVHRLFICAKFFLALRRTGFASGIADRRYCRYRHPLPGAAQSVGSSCWGTGPLDWCHGIGVGGGPADASRRTQPRYDVRYHTGLIFLYMLREPVKLSPPMRPQARIGTANNANDPSGLGATGTTRRPCGAVHLRCLRFLRFPFFLLTLGAWKGRMARRAVGYRRRLCASSAVGPAAAGGRLGGWP